MLSTVGSLAEVRAADRIGATELLVVVMAARLGVGMHVLRVVVLYRARASLDVDAGLFPAAHVPAAAVPSADGMHADRMSTEQMAIERISSERI